MSCFDFLDYSLAPTLLLDAMDLHLRFLFVSIPLTARLLYFPSCYNYHILYSIPYNNPDACLDKDGDYGWISPDIDRLVDVLAFMYFHEGICPLRKSFVLEFDPTWDSESSRYFRASKRKYIRAV